MNFEIFDNKSSRKIRFSMKEKDYFFFEILGDIAGSIRVYSYSPHSDAIESVFEKLGKLQNPWGGDISWVSLEGEFYINFTCDSVGHVLLSVEINNRNEQFKINCGLNLDFGQLQEISRKASGFFERNA